MYYFLISLNKQVEKVYRASDIAREMLEPIVITLTESDEETDTADEFDDDIY